MLQILTTKPVALRGKSKAPAAKNRGSKAPPIIVTPPAQYPESVFGKLPAGFVLKEQSIYLLAHWHRRAMQAVDDLPTDHTDDELTEAMAIANELFDAIKQSNDSGSRALSAQMNAIVERFRFMRNTTSIEEELSVADFVFLAERMSKATTVVPATKRLGALARGRKLTRAGLLSRYQSFLVQELMTVSLNLYGNETYAFSFIFVDDEVTKRCRSPSRRMRHPFLDEAKLITRARSVLGSLKINSQTAEERT